MLNSKEERELPFELMDYFNMGPLKVRINFELGPTIDIRPLIVLMNRMMNSLANRRNQALEEEATAMDGYMISVLVKTIGWMRMKSLFDDNFVFDPSEDNFYDVDGNKINSIIFILDLQ